ncbi:NAD(+) synthase [Blastopirellula marina]|uniref:Glutamine-dependent NAD(+) synthetase n=1 Tax=Blastopirellula marina TaxID=124 RepID=A0A2S8GDH7_9BACT|nr:NAD(+) synthase [Blastopirellula marina]PQO42518.1 NAD(+) synthase [Blastopirellula marina]
MLNVKVAAAVLNQTPMDWEANTRNILEALDKARGAGASVVCLPELCITGYGCEDAFLSAGMRRMAWDKLQELVPATAGLVACFGLPISYRGLVFNVAAVCANGKLLGLVPKRNLAGDGLHYEPRWFKPWPKGKRAFYEEGDQKIPLGDLIFDFGGTLLGLEICEDAWVASRPGSQLAELGVDIILNPSASHFAFQKQEVRRRFVLEGSRAFHSAYVYANLLGNEAGRTIYDGGAMIASAGHLLAEARRFSFADCVVTTAVVDIDVNRMNRAKSDAFVLNFDASKDQVVRGDFPLPHCEPDIPEHSIPVWEDSEHLKEEEFTRAVTLGLFDYLRKSRSRGFVVSLSGGADSAAVTTLCAYMVQFALMDIGTHQFAKKLAYIEGLDGVVDPQGVNQKLLTCVYQATRNSGDVTHNAAQKVAETVGADFHRVDVDDLVQGYTQLGEQILGRPLTWEQDDIALQNIQARTRSPSVWLVANLKGALLLSTSNRSEAAVGYATMDGDTSGGLCPISGIDKAFLRQWLIWMEEEGPIGVGCLPVLKLINEQQPTAELRPSDQGQTDEADLMPYTILDRIERLAIRDKQIAVEVLHHLRQHYPGHSPRELGGYIERFFQLWSRNQWKRERYAPGFHVDDENLDPKTWCRFPILSGGFRVELADMWRVIEGVEA